MSHYVTGTRVPLNIMHKLPIVDIVECLAPREREMVELLCEGCGMKLVAQAMGITLGTAKVYLNRIFQKVEVRSTVELVSLVLQGRISALTTQSLHTSHETLVY